MLKSTTWYTWWERATSQVIAPILQYLLAAVGQSKAKVSVQMTVNWSAIPAARTGFEVALPLWDLVEGKRQIAVCIIIEQRELTLEQSDQPWPLDKY